MCGGTGDLLAYVNGVLTLIDFKTSSGIRHTHIAQAVTYADMVGEVYDRIVEDVVILRFGRNKSSEELHLTEDMKDRGRQVFMLARQLERMDMDLLRDTRSGIHLINRPVNSVKVTVMGR